MRKINKQRLRGASFEQDGWLLQRRRRRRRRRIPLRTAAATKKALILCLRLVAGRCFDVSRRHLSQTPHICDVDEAVNSTCRFEAQAAQEKELHAAGVVRGV
jgi:hypothetical protein